MPVLDPPRPTANRTPLVEYLKIQRDRDAEVIQALTSASERIQAELIRLGSGANTGAPGKLVRGYQLRKAQSAIHRELASTWHKIGNVVEAGRAEATAKAVDLSFPDSLLANILPSEDRAALLESLKAGAGQGITALEHRLSGASYRPLATSVYHNVALSYGRVDKIVNDALARGASARELAKDVRSFIRPDVSGGVSYAAMRLARTEINNAFHAGQVFSAQRNPMITGVRWNLSGSHPKPDECNDFAEHGGTGIWNPMEVPGKPHPHCLCFMTDELPDKDEFLRRYEAGHYDDFLAEHGAVDAVAPEPDSPLAGLKRIKPQGYREAAKRVNPGFGDTADEYGYNCHYVVEAMEMRARGYNVVASPTYRNLGRYDYSVEQDWIVPSVGKSREFTRVSFGDASPTMGDLEDATTWWPPNSRGFIAGTFKNNAGGHIFSMYKDGNGKLRFVDGQNGSLDSSNNLDRMKNVRIMRVDDLEPVERRVADAVATKTEKTTKGSVEQRVRLENHARMWSEDAASIPSHSAYRSLFEDKSALLQAELANYPLKPI